MPLHLKCEGEWRSLQLNQQPEPAITSVTVDGANITVENFAPVPISSDDDVWTFGGDKRAKVGPSGQINRITGQALIVMQFPESILLLFEGVCHKTERLF